MVLHKGGVPLFSHLHVFNKKSDVLSLFLSVHVFFFFLQLFLRFSPCHWLWAIWLCCALLDIVFFMFLVLGIDWDLGAVDLSFLLNLEIFQPLFLQTLFLSPPLSSCFQGLQLHQAVWSFVIAHRFSVHFLKIIFSRCVSFWIVSIAVSSSS